MARIVTQDKVYFSRDRNDPKILGKAYRCLLCMEGVISMSHLFDQHKNIDDTPTTSQLSQACIAIANRYSDKIRFWYGYEEKISAEDWFVRSLFLDLYLGIDTWKLFLLSSSRGSTRELLMDNERYVETIQAGNIKDAIDMASWLVSRQSEIVLFRYLQRAANDPDFIPVAKSHIIDGFLRVLNQVPSDIGRYFNALKVVESLFLARSATLS